MDTDLCELFSLQSKFVCLNKYEDEFKTQKILYGLPKNLQLCEKLTLHWLKTQEKNEDNEFAMKDDSDRIKESNELRSEGNRLYTAQKERNILGACRLYNDAIFAALDSKSGNEISLGFANRAMALQTFGYYQQAYDDCMCALKTGYPNAMRHKIITRQAFCSLQLKDAKALESHLNELDQMTLNDNFQKQLLELKESLANICETNKKSELEDGQAGSRESQIIVETGTELGRVMKVKSLIQRNQLIFHERIPSFVPVGDGRRLCHQCAITSFIPYPCFKCRGRVIYCSLRCQEVHRSIHDYECAGYRFQLFARVGIAHLALRTILDNGIFSIVDHLKTKTNTEEVWKSLTANGDIYKDNKLPYAESLRMISHLNQMTIKDIQWFTLVSHLLVVYLKYYTHFFKDLEKHNNSIEWELLTSSLILRHIGQLISNGHMLTTLLPKPLNFSLTDFHLLNDRVWTSPWHLKAGYLHTFAYYDDLASLNLPYLSICNHSCVQSFQPKFSGRYVSTFALKDLHEGDEITNCYDLDYRKVKRSSRQQRLKATYYFDCGCENCIQPKEDFDFNQYHRYRCDNKNCGKIFVPDLPERPSLNWWQKAEIDVTLFCTKCGCEQRLEWFHELKNLLEHRITQWDARRRLYDIFKSLGDILLGFNDARAYIASKLCSEWFNLQYHGIYLTDQDYDDIIAMTNYSLEYTKSQSCINSIEYVAEMTYLWDIAAIGKYKWCSKERDEMLFALNIISDDLKLIFLNYYNDYIKID
ncbi:SET and MYND domain-containing protein 4 [Stomoxys calcitrans]|uniref:SET and MYND domain-containing protein 4 n=1 Tax=Stomoxys calcitrans TaxID=35570 RepID=UPI0027E2E85C|nr:SET and MYND domain-containing protein 4 [Stomoxys calcitrans]XP_013105002.2 SET and MYND domain-containing protein 4 [Stomoxys calcitrans]